MAASSMGMTGVLVGAIDVAKAYDKTLVDAAERIGDTSHLYFFVCTFVTLLGAVLASFENSVAPTGMGFVSHIDECADSAYALFGHSSFLDGSGLGRLEPLREVFAGTPNGPSGLSGIFVVVASFCSAVASLVDVAAKAICRLGWRRRRKVAPTGSTVPASTTHEKVQMGLAEEFGCYVGYFQIFALGFFREYTLRFMAAFLRSSFSKKYVDRERWNSGFVDFYITHAYAGIEDCFGRPIKSSPDSTVTVVKRKRKGGLLFGPLNKLQMTNESVDCINLSSYNYLGFGGIDSFCTPFAREVALKHGFSCSGSRSEGGTMVVHRELEETVAAFLKKEDAVVLGMGFASNSTILPALFEAQSGGKGILVLSDELNHRSIVEGIRLAGVSVSAFQHNNMLSLEDKLKTAVENGQQDGKPWRKIFIVVEGIYSMEGDFCRLREIVTLKNRYKAYLYLDEAHSIGAVGQTGRGVTELLGVPTSEVEVMMGTFTKSYGSAGGYVASSREVIAAIRRNAPGSVVASAMSAPCAAQALQAFKVIAGQEGGDAGAKKLAAIKENANFFRRRLEEEGFKILGDFDSPIIPVMVHHPIKIASFSKQLLEQGLAVVVVGYPVVPIQYERARFCISASHTREQLTDAIEKITKVGHSLGLLFDLKMDKAEAAARAERDKRYSHWLYNAPLETRTEVSISPCARQWTPEPLTPSTGSIGPLQTLSLTAVTTVVKQTPFDFRLFDPIGYAAQPTAVAKRAIQDAMDVYGFGACGPRGFYGGALPHYSLEGSIAKFLDVENAIVYSSAAVTCSSVIQALIQSGDRVLLDADANLGVRAGIRLTKFGDVGWVNQGSVQEMETKLVAWNAADKLNKKKERKPRTFIFVEGLCGRTGRLAPLADILVLKERYGAYIILDESHSIGTLGATGRGLCEHLGVSSRKIDVIIGSLEHALANVGGFCAGRYEPVHHQRLAGPGYCYSAASPPASAAAAIATIEHIGNSAEGALARNRLWANTLELHKVLQSVVASSAAPLQLISDAESYVQHLRWTGPAEDAEVQLVQIAQKCELTTGVIVQVCIPGSCSAEGAFCEKLRSPPFLTPTIRLCATSEHTELHLKAVAEGISAALNSMVQGSQ